MTPRGCPCYSHSQGSKNFTHAARRTFRSTFPEASSYHTRMCRDFRWDSCPSLSNFGEHFESLHHFVFLDHTQDLFSARAMSRGWSSESTILLTRCNRSGVSSSQSLMKKIWDTHTTCQDYRVGAVQHLEESFHNAGKYDGDKNVFPRRTSAPHVPQRSA